VGDVQYGFVALYLVKTKFV